MGEINQELQNLLNVKFNYDLDKPKKFLTSKYLPILQFASKNSMSDEDQKLVIEKLQSDIKLVFKNLSQKEIDFYSEKFLNSVSKYLQSIEKQISYNGYMDDSSCGEDCMKEEKFCSELTEQEKNGLLKYFENKIKSDLDAMLKLMSKEQAEIFLEKLNEKIANLK
jgi:hypothetical protein